MFQFYSVSHCILALFVSAWNIALTTGLLPLILLFSIGLNQGLSAWLVVPPWPRLLTHYLFPARFLLYLFSTAITLVTALMNWLPVFHLQWLSHPFIRQESFAHNYCVELSNTKITGNLFSDGFFPSTSCLWNSLPSVFPASFNLPSFKRQVYYHRRDQMS